jgi:hypothetical protein
MKRLMIMALLGGQLAVAAQPALAAEFADGRSQEMGAFGGVRLRVPLDGNFQQRRVRAGLTLAPVSHSRTASGESRMRMGEGLELGVVGREPVRLAIGGQDVRRLGAAQGDEDEDRDDGPGTVGWIAIGFAGLVLVGAGIVYFMFEDINED